MSSRVIKPEILIELVHNTAPFLFEDTLSKSDREALDYKTGEFPPHLEFVDTLRRARAEPFLELSLTDYFNLCISSHFATVGTFVPTDVDLAIRQKLWQGVHHEKSFLPFWELVQKFHAWDESFVSKRFVKTPSGRKLSGHQGEWFSIAMGAYGTALKSAHEFLPEVREAIEAEFKNQELALSELKGDWEANPSVLTAQNFLAGIAAVAHNLGDLDRMFDAWEIPETDVLKRRVYRAGHEDARHPRTLFIQCGGIYQAMLSHENHRHFALREPKALRKSSQFLLPFGPFFDDWGFGLIRDGLTTELFSEGDLREVIEALVLGWKKLNPNSIFTSQGYARALYGIATALGGVNASGKSSAAEVKAGLKKMEASVPPVIRRELTESGIRTLLNASRAEFEKKWMSRLRMELHSPSETG